MATTLIGGNATARQPRSKSAWYAPTTAKFFLALLVMQGVLFLSSTFRWFWFNQHKGYTVLITVAATASLLLLFALVALVSWFFRRKTQFSLATLLLMVPVMAIPCAWLAQEVALAREQQELAQSINGASGHVDASFDDFVLRKVLKPPPPPNPWAYRLLGEQFFFKDVKHVTLGGQESYQGIHAFNRLESLLCTSPTNADMIHLHGLPQLYRLTLVNSSVTDVGLEPLGKLPSLQILHLDGSRISGDGLRHLEGLKHIKHIGLSDTGLTDAGLVHLSKLANLETLWLERTSVTDAGLVHLYELKKLRVLLLDETAVTDQGVAALQKTLPLCTIDRE
jgi:Leucine-rich repeat (LRR) protein